MKARICVCCSLPASLFSVSLAHFSHVLNTTQHCYGTFLELESRVDKAREEGWEDKFKLNGTELGGLFKIRHLLKSSMEKWTWESPGSLGLV